MPFRNRPFESKLRNLIKLEVKKTRQKKEFKANKSKVGGTIIDSGKWVSFLVPMIITVLIMSASPRQHMFLIIYPTLLLIYSLFMTSHYLSQLESCGNYQILAHFAISPRQYFEHVTRKILFNIFIQIFVTSCLVLFFGGVLFRIQVNAYFLVPIYAFLQVFITMSFIMFLGHFFPKLHFIRIGICLIGLLILFFHYEPFLNTFSTEMSIVASSCNFGANALIYYIYLDKSIPNYCLIIPLFIVIPVLIFLYRYCRDNFTKTFVLHDEIIVDDFSEDDISNRILTSNADLSTIIKEELQCPAYLNDDGFLNRFLSKIISDREREILCFFTWGNINLTSALQVNFIFHSIIFALLCLFDGTWAYIISGLLFMVTLINLPLLGGNWQGLDKIQFFTISIPFYSFYPIAYNETLRLLLKINIIRCASWLPSGMFIFGIVFYKCTDSIRQSIIYASYVAVMVLVTVFVGASYKLLQTKSQYRSTFTNLLCSLAVIAQVGTPIISLLIIILLKKNHMIDILIVILLTLFSIFMFCFNLFLYKKLKLDFVHLVRESS